QLLGMIFVMKFQAAAMGRANMPEDQREDFTLYVDEFQNFATESFATILSEARKYRLSLVLANQFMTQLTDQIREAILGNIGTVISGRIGITDAEILQKRFAPEFDAEDLARLPNFQTISSVMINNVPSAAFSMSLMPALGKPNPQLRDALKKLSAAKYGRPRAEVEREIFARLGAGDEARKAKTEALKQAQQQRIQAMAHAQQSNNLQSSVGGVITPQGSMPRPSEPSSFLDDWLAKREQIQSVAPRSEQNAAYGPVTGQTAPAPSEPIHAAPQATSNEEASLQQDSLQIRGSVPDSDQDNDFSVKLR
ncbi:MAG TPA: type IV secretory system conjugative DNA transfer family protein, partial [Candidatus Saccharibacteria bacterium]|nr:type IV secretory system conjugative DNA transfer family protein [Candidatus Saccharibacteria bacterium]